MKKLAAIMPSPTGHWVGDGFPVRTMFSPQSLGTQISPFLLLDYAGPKEFPPADRPRGVEEHPHRGFETVTIVYQGAVEHRDSAGNKGRIGPGDVQWMTAASGVVHEEMHDREFTRRGGTFEVVQLWVNLPARIKMSPPRYQELPADQIPVVKLANDSGSVRVIAGEFQGQKGPAQTYTPINVLDLRLRANTRLDLPLNNGFTTAVFVLKGKVRFNSDQTAGDAQLALFERPGDGISIEAGADSTLLVLSGEPIDEPIASYGPFVMNTQEEIHQAIADFRAGRMGKLA
jgi:redox-sensitive bicupin YhaK (pirin superfamily)